MAAPELARLFLAFFRTAREGDNLAADTHALTFLTRLALLGAERPPAVRAAGRERRAVRLILDFLEGHAASNVNLTQLTSLTGLSPSYLVRSFKREMGVPPHVYHMHHRLLHAKQLLLRGEPIPQAAHELGFADQSHFTRLFRRYLGVTPGAYAVTGGQKRSIRG